MWITSLVVNASYAIYLAKATSVRPPALTTGGVVRIVAPGGAVTASSLSTGENLLRTSYNLTVERDTHVLDVDLYYAGTDAVRAQEVLDAFADTAVEAIWAARGGYGTARILSTVQGMLLPGLTASPKWLVGYSDITALHALWNRAGLVSMHGPIGSDIQSFTQAARDNLFSVLSNTDQLTQTFSGSIRYTGPSGGGAAGRLLGGNLSVLASLVGSGFLPSYQGAILLVEDTGEAAYSVDRLLTTLLRSADFQGIVGIAIGQLINADTSTYTALQLLDRTLSPLGLPVITGLAIGHDTTRAMPVVLGADAEIDVVNSQLKVYVPAA